MGVGFVNGAIGGGMKGGVIGAFSAGLFHGIGSTFTKEITPWAFNGNRMSIAGRLAKAAAHGTAAGVTELLRGGKFGHGFVSTAAPELLHPQIGKLPTSPVRILSAALLGGALSHATGGKFANGAVTAAFMWAFNHEGHASESKGSDSTEPDIFDIDAAVKNINKNVVLPFGHRLCATHVGNAIRAGGLNLGNTLSAKDFGPLLEKVGFVEISIEVYEPIAGDVAVIQGFPGDSGRDGHIQMYDGNRWVSDFPQRTFYPGPAYREHQPSYKIYRHPSGESR
jgi:hypothetical protein